MKQKVNFKRITALTLLLTAISILIYTDYSRLEKGFRGLKKQLQDIRYDSLVKGKVILVKFNGKQMTISDYKTGMIIISQKVPVLKKVIYDTKVGSDTIVFDKGTTNSFNLKVHGGEIVLGSWLGFKRHLHINCAGYIKEGKYPDEQG